MIREPGVGSSKGGQEPGRCFIWFSVLQRNFDWTSHTYGSAMSAQEGSAQARHYEPASTEDKWVADGKGSAGCGWSIPPHLHGKSAREGSDEARACLPATEAIL